jgi:hypothetical protein
LEILRGVGIASSRRKFEVMRVECAWVRGFEKFEGTIVALNVLGKCAWKVRGSVGGKFLDVQECGLRKVLEINCEGTA